MNRKIKSMLRRFAFCTLLSFVGLLITGCKIFPPPLEPKHLIPPLIDPTDLVPGPHHGYHHKPHHDPYYDPGPVPPPHYHPKHKHHKEPKW